MKELGKFCLKLQMKIQCSVEESRTGASCSIFLNRLDSGFHHLFIGGKSQIVVGAEHDHAIAFHCHNRSLLALKTMEIRVDILGLVLVNDGVVLTFSKRSI